MNNDTSAGPITPREAAAQLDGNEYRNEGTPELFRRMKGTGLVAVFGASDDVMEVRGAVDDEMGMLALFTRAGLLEKECENDECPYFRKRRNKAASVEALWCEEPPFSFTYQTSIPHETFVIHEDGEPYCRGIVFSLVDCPDLQDG